MDFKYINLDYLNLMSDGDDDMKKVMIEMLLEEVPAEVAKLNQMHEAADWKELREVSHKLKSTLSFIGNPTMTEANKRVEDIAKAVDGIEELPSLLEAITAAYPAALSELKMAFSSLEAV